MRARWIAALVIAAGVLVAPSMRATARVAIAPRCPAAHPEDGDPCLRRDLSCSFPCGRPGDVDYTCTCVESDDGRLKWGCLHGHVCS